MDNRNFNFHYSIIHQFQIKEKINRIISKHTGKDLSKIESDTDRDFWLDPKEAKEYGIIDEIIKRKR